MRVFQAVDASGYARVDFLMDRKTGRMYVNEINTIPGFTSISMFPKLWERHRPRLRRPALAARGPRVRAAPAAPRAAHRLPLTGAAALLLAAGRRRRPRRPRTIARPSTCSTTAAPRRRRRAWPALAGAAIPTIPCPSTCRRWPWPGSSSSGRKSTALDRTLEQAADRAWAMADARVRADPADARALFARGAASGVRSRHHLFRLRRAEAARTAAADARGPARGARAGSGRRRRALRPRPLRLLRGRAAARGAAPALPRAPPRRRPRARPGRHRGGAAGPRTLHGVEAQAQLYEIHAFYEGRSGGGGRRRWRAWPAAIRGWPLWGLKLAEHLRDRLGAYAESEAVARAAHRGAGRAPAHDPGAARPGPGPALARRVAPARPPAGGRAPRAPARSATACPAIPASARGAPAARPRASSWKATARARPRTTARPRPAGDREWRKRAQGRRSRIRCPAAEVSGRQRLAPRAARARGRRAARRRPRTRARPSRAWPAVARGGARSWRRQELRAGRAKDARVPEVDEAREGEPPWLVPWSRLLRAQQADLEGERAAAVALYKKVYANAVAAAGAAARPRRRVCARLSGGNGLASRAGTRAPRAESDAAVHRVDALFAPRRPQAKPSHLSGMPRRLLKKILDKGEWRPYPTPSMSSPLSPTMLIRGSSVQTWTERGDYRNGREEEGRQEGRIEEEEVSAPGTRGGGPITPSTLSS